MSVPPQHAPNMGITSLARKNRSRTATVDDDAVARIKERLPIEEVIGETVALKPVGRNILEGLCPLHAEKTPSFKVYTEEGRFYCYGCKKSGTVFDFVAETQGLDFRGALELLAQRAGIELGSGEGGTRRRDLYDVNNLAEDYFTARLAEHPEVQEYLTGRGFSLETVQAWGLGYAPEGGTNLTRHAHTKGMELDALEAAGLAKNKDGRYYDFFRGRVTIPIRDLLGRVVGFSARTLKDETPKYLNTPETAVFHKSEILFGLDRAKEAIRKRRAAVLVEGQPDVIALHQAGFAHAVGLQSSSLNERQIAALERLGVTRLYAALDADDAGRTATYNILNTNQRRLDVRVVPITGGKDPAEMLQTDPGSFGAALEAAQSETEWRYNDALRDGDPRTHEGRDKFLARLKPALKDGDKPGSGGELRELVAAAIGADVTTADLKAFAGGQELTLDAHLDVEDDAALRKQLVRDRVAGEIEAFPLEVLPTPVRAYVEACAAALPVPADFVAAPALATVATAIGHSRKIFVKNAWQEGARLWVAIVGDPGSRKSPALNKARDPLSQTQKYFKKLHTADLEVYGGRLREYEAERSGRKKGESPPEHPGDAPEMRQLMTTDATFEAIVTLHDKNSRGLLFHQDELSGWVKSMDQYKGGRGNDRQRWLSTWSGDEVISNRKGKQAEVIPDPYINICGGIQPDILPALQSEGADGFVDRILFSYPKVVRKDVDFDADVADEVVAGYRRVVSLLSNLEQVETADGPQPKLLKMTAEAEDVFKQWLKDHRTRTDAPDLGWKLKGAYSKMEGYCARFALILHLLAYAAGEEADETISAMSVSKAVDLTHYFMNHAARIYKQLGNSPEDKSLTAILEYLERRPKHHWTAREINRAGLPGCTNTKVTKALLQKLTDAGLVKFETFKHPHGRPGEGYVLAEGARSVG